MKTFFMQFIHSYMSGQQVCSHFFEAEVESLEEARKHAYSMDGVGLILLLEEREPFAQDESEPPAK